MSRLTNIALRAKVNEHRRISHLSGDHRIGASSRRQVRQLQLQWVRMLWPLLIGAAGFAAAISALVVWFAPDSIAPYLIGALVASVFWVLIVMMMVTGGMTTLWSGILGEQWTASELRKFKRHGWRTINHLMLQNWDVDHVLLGPGGFFAVETKFRSDWSAAKPYLYEVATTATEAARQVRLRIDPRGESVRAVVVMWGPNLRDHFAETTDIGGVTFCPGRLLHDFVTQRQRILDDDVVQSAFLKLSEYVSKRDLGELADSGPIPRTVTRGIYDVAFAIGTVMVLALAITAPAAVSPHGLWSLVIAVLGTAIAVRIRHRQSESVRVRLLTTAAIAISGGLGLLIAVAMAVEAMQ